MKTLIAILVMFAAVSSARVHAQVPATTTIPPGFMSVDTANRMIGSYLDGNGTDTTALRSLQVDASLLRQLLADTTIKQLKLVLAHTVEYIDTGNEGHFAGCNSTALTLVVVGVDSFGNYVYGPGQSVIDRLRPCPYLCPLGTAAGNLLD